MNNKLEKKLKDAGCPQNIDIGGKNYDQNGQLWIASLEARPLPPQDTYVPTLSELIEACGVSFRELEKYSNTENGKLVYYWAAYAIDDATGRMTGGSKFKGSTPEESVANLWMALNKKS